MNVELLISNEKGTKAYIPPVEEGIEWEVSRRSTPGKLTFKVLDDGKSSFSEGSAVSLIVDGTKVFYGFVFSQKRARDKIITVTAYDQLRYLQNKDTYVYKNKTAAQVIKMIAADFGLKTGTVKGTSFKISSRVEENTSLFDIIENALDLELANKGAMFVLYDSYGKLTLKNISDMYVVKNGKYLLLDAETGENFEYTSSIDTNTYNQVKLTYDNEKTGKREIYIARSSKNINRWGVLQYFDKLDKGENGKAKAKALLALYNSKTRNLKLTNQFGDWRVRAGSLVLVSLDLGDTKIQNFMMVEKVKHTIKDDQHWMDLTLRGGEFVAE